jgi:hypothetical protein
MPHYGSHAQKLSAVPQPDIDFPIGSKVVHFVLNGKDTFGTRFMLRGCFYDIYLLQLGFHPVAVVLSLHTEGKNNNIYNIYIYIYIYSNATTCPCRLRGPPLLVVVEV